MGLLELTKVWWEALGLTAEEAVAVDEAIATQSKASKAIACTDCGNLFNNTDWHDCTGRLDELHWRKKGGKLTHSMRARMHKKYGKSETLKEDSENYLNSLSREDYEKLEVLYQHKLDIMNSNDPTWLIEEDLWNS